MSASWISPGRPKISRSKRSSKRFSTRRCRRSSTSGPTREDDLEPSRGVMGVMDKRKAWQHKLNEDRWAAILWPEEWGGRAATTAQQVIYTQVMAKYRSPGIYNANGIVQIGPSIISWGTEDQKARWLPGILDATEHWCQGFSEPQAGSDLANLRTTAILSDDESHYVVNGQKIWISLRADREVGPVPVAHRPDRDLARPQARRHHRVHHRHGAARHRHPPDPRDHGRLVVLRGVLHRREDPGRRPARRRGQRLARVDGRARPGARRQRGPGDLDGAGPAHAVAAPRRPRTPTRCGPRDPRARRAGCTSRSSTTRLLIAARCRRC